SSPPVAADDGAIWDPTTDAWSPLPPRPSGIARIVGGTGDGDRLIAVAAATDGSLLVLGLHLGPSTGPAPAAPPGGPASTPSGRGTAPAIGLPPAADAPTARVVIDPAPEGFVRDPGDRGSGPRYVDPRSPDRSIVIEIIRTDVSTDLLDAWRSRDGGRL